MGDEFKRVTGQCVKHGPWIRNCEAKTAHLMRDKCPECEGVETGPKRLSFDLVTIHGNCDFHGGAWTNRVMASHADRMRDKCPKCTEDSLRAEREHESSESLASRNDKRERKIKELAVASGIPRRFQARSFDNYRAESPEQKQALERSQNYARKFNKVMERGASMIFYGPPGTGKTHMSCAIANHVMREFGASAVFTTVFEMFQHLKSTYGGKATKSELEVMNLYAGVDLLVLDEIGVQLGSNFESVMITDIINRRYSDMKPTLILSNLDLEGLKKYLGERVIDRMSEGGGGMIAFNWDSYRPKVMGDDDLPKGTYDKPDWL